MAPCGGQPCAGSEVHTCARPQAWLNQRQLSDKGLRRAQAGTMASGSATLLSAEASPANVTTSATGAVGVVATMVWHAPSRPRANCFREAGMDEAVTSWFG